MSHIIANLYYSKKCQYSNNILQIIDNNKLTSLFNLISIDTMHPVDLINQNIKSVPTIVIIYNNKKHYYENEIAFNFIYKNIEMNTLTTDSFDSTNLLFSKWYKNVSDYEKDSNPNLSTHKFIDRPKQLYVPESIDNSKLTEHQMKIKINNLKQIRNNQDALISKTNIESINNKLKK